MNNLTFQRSLNKAAYNAQTEGTAAVTEQTAAAEAPAFDKEAVGKMTVNKALETLSLDHLAELGAWVKSTQKEQADKQTAALAAQLTLLKASGADVSALLTALGISAPPTAPQKVEGDDTGKKPAKWRDTEDHKNVWKGGATPKWAAERKTAWINDNNARNGQDAPSADDVYELMKDAFEEYQTWYLANEAASDDAKKAKGAEIKGKYALMTAAEAKKYKDDKKAASAA